jgi:SsrA-binding protein
MTAREEAGKGTLATNRKARHEYHILDSWEAGLSLTGGEVKSCRAGQASLAEAYASFNKGELFILRHAHPALCRRQIRLQRP